jgi:nucleoside-diphosphate-sugar epimerase
MNLLITSAASSLAQSLAHSLGEEHAVRLTERIPTPNLADFAVCALGHDLSTNLLVRGVDAIVHVAEPLPTDNELQQIDYLTRCTYNLCMAAVAEGVRRLVYLSTLDLMTAYDDGFTVSERWRPLPSPAAPLLARYLGEQVCREFAREHKLDVAVLRLGRVVQAATVAGAPFDPCWVDEQDVAQAVRRALVTDTGRWAIFHIQHAGPQARFSIATAQRVLGFAPGVDFSFPG